MVRKSPKLLKSRSLKSRLLKGLKKSQRSLRSKVKKLKSSARGERTRGWSALAPRSVGDKLKMYNKCKSKCFLLPNKKSPKKSKFPICIKPVNGRVSCKPNCKGLLAAKVRSRQFRGKSRRYANVSKKVDKLAKSVKCKWINRSKSKLSSVVKSRGRKTPKVVKSRRVK